MWYIDKMFHIGDLADFHYISRHQTDPTALGPLEELEATKEELSRWVSAFPEMSLCIGNHDTILERQAASLGIPSEFLRNLNELFDLPDTWVWQDRWVLNEGTNYVTVIEHGLGSNGMYGAKNTAKNYMCNYIQGHSHAHAGVFWVDGLFKSVYGMQVGCGMSPDKYFSKYAKHFKNAQSYGCGIVLDIDTPDPTPMFRRMHIE